MNQNMCVCMYVCMYVRITLTLQPATCFVANPRGYGYVFPRRAYCRRDEWGMHSVRLEPIT